MTDKRTGLTECIDCGAKGEAWPSYPASLGSCPLCGHAMLICVAKAHSPTLGQALIMCVADDCGGCPMLYAHGETPEDAVRAAARLWNAMPRKKGPRKQSKGTERAAKDLLAIAEGPCP